ncbi:MAG: hypothetical protein M4579_007016 [Chaenotheca gracillima]|nr:MAG: hypothetical protein M4579_007016 [Chaenotheca gracillima]
MAAEANWRRPWEAEQQQQQQQQQQYQQHQHQQHQQFQHHHHHHPPPPPTQHPSIQPPPSTPTTDRRPNGLAAARSTVSSSATTPTTNLPPPLPSPHDVRLPPIQASQRAPLPSAVPPPNARPATQSYLGRDVSAHARAHSPPSPKRLRLESGPASTRPDVQRTSSFSSMAPVVGDRTLLTPLDSLGPRYEQKSTAMTDPYSAQAQSQAQTHSHGGFPPGYAQPEQSRGANPQWAQCRNCGAVHPLVEELVSSLVELDLELAEWSPGKTTASRIDAPHVHQVGAPQSLDWAIRTLHNHKASARQLRSRCMSLESRGRDIRPEDDQRRRPERSASSASAAGAPLPSPQTAHFQDLQHQVSTKSLALQTLQQEHDSLLAAFSRAQTRCSTFEKKVQVSDTEISNLTEERIKLQSQVDAFETQVEELVRSRDEARKQSVANGGQYMKIMEMASQLEAQGSADKKKFTSEKDEWAQERESLNQRIAHLEKENEMQLNLLFAPKGPEGQPAARTITRTKTARLGSATSPAPESKRPSQVSLPAPTETPPTTATPTPPVLADAKSPELSQDTTTAPISSPKPPTSPTTAAVNSLFGAPSNRLKSHPLSSPAVNGPFTTDRSGQDNILLSESLPALRGEIVHLRKCCQSMEIAMQDIKSEGYRIDQLMQRFGNIGKRVVSKADGGIGWTRLGGDGPRKDFHPEGDEVNEEIAGRA